MRLLLVEDDTMIGRALRQGLVEAGFVVDWVHDGRAADLSVANGVYDLVVLDLGLPRMDGRELLRTLRSRGDTIAVLVVTARDAVAERIAGLDAGADDYVLKPFDLEELLARVRALLRRRDGNAVATLRVGELELDPVRKQLTLQGAVVDLSAKQFAVMHALMRRPGAVLSCEQLEEAVYGWGDEVGSNAIEVHLHNLRKLIGSERIKNVRGVGYRIAEA